jgi:type II secretory pathway pseudopilin PulG
MRNNKGFSTLELIVSFVLISFIAIAMFRAVLMLNDRLFYHQNAYQITVLIGSMSNSIQQDLLNNLDNQLTTDIVSCGTDCYEIYFKDNSKRTIKIDRNLKLIQYGDYIEKLPTDFSFGEDGISLGFAQHDEVETTGVYNSIFSLKIPIVSDIYDDEYAIDIVYAYYDDTL